MWKFLIKKAQNSLIIKYSYHDWKGILGAWFPRAAFIPFHAGKSNELSYVFFTSEVLLLVFTYVLLEESRKQKQWRHGLGPREKGPCRLHSQQHPRHISGRRGVCWMNGKMETAHTYSAELAQPLHCRVMGIDVYSSSQEGWEAHSEPLFGISNVLFLHWMREFQSSMEKSSEMGFMFSLAHACWGPRLQKGRDPLLPAPVITPPHSHQYLQLRGKEAGLQPYTCHRRRPGSAWLPSRGSDVESTLDTP